MKIFTTLLLVLLSTMFGFSATYYVDASRLDDSGVATNWATAKKTIQAAVNTALDGDTVLVTNGTYNAGGKMTPDYSLMNRVSITNAVTVQSINGPKVTIIQGKPSSTGVDGLGTDAVRGVYISNGGVLNGFTVSNGHTFHGYSLSTLDHYGGGVVLQGQSCTITNCILSSNASYWGGGGVFLSNGGTTTHCKIIGNSTKHKGGGANIFQRGNVDFCTISNNTAGTEGGGAYVYVSSGMGTLNSCSIVNNTAGDTGGGAWIRPGAYVMDCRLTGNTANGRGGGGVYCAHGGIVERCELSENTGPNGGGVYLRSGGTLNSCLILDNQADFAGGARFWEGGTINYSTLHGNQANNYGGGIHFYQGGTLNNSIAWNNMAPVGSDIYTYGSSTRRYVCASDGVSHGVIGCITSNPMFVDSGNKNFELKNGSPCINKGSNFYPPYSPYDFSGNPRISNGTIDMGAIEYNALFSDSNQDGVPDQWYLTHGLDCTNITTGLYDPDNDFQSTHDEYIAGTDPTNGMSNFSIKGFTNTPFGNINWNSVSGRIYSVYWSTNLIDGFESLETNIPWTVNSFTDIVHNTEQQVFYQISVELE